MKRSEIRQLPKYYDKYIEQVEDIEILIALEKYDAIIDEEDLLTCKILQDQVYAEEKWTIKQIFQHIIDVERIIVYRALRFARNDKTEIPGFEENDFAKEMRTDQKSIATLAIEFNLLRRANTMMFKEFKNVHLKRKGIASGVSISVLSLGFLLVGHQKHHISVIREKYFPLLD